jgi:hypothetical protein
MAIIDISGQNDTDVVNGAIITNTTMAISTGTGVFEPFLAIQRSPIEEGFNTDSHDLPLDDTHDEFTHSLLLSTIPTRTVNGVDYLEFRVDLNEPDAGSNDLILLQQLKIFQEATGNQVEANWNGTDFGNGGPKYTLGNNQVLLSAEWDAGSGKGDYVFLIPKSNFDFQSPNQFVVVYMKMGTTDNHDPAQSSGGFDEFGVLVAPEPPPSILIEKSGPATIAEGGEDVTYHFVITNTSGLTDPVTVTSLTDDVLGNLLAAAQAANGGNPIVLASGASFSFDYNPPGDLVLNAGDTEHNTVTVIGHDDENTSVTDTDDHTITATNAPPVIDIVKSGPATVVEGGEDVVYHFTITNNSGQTDPVTVTSLGDNVLGNLLGVAEAAFGGTIVLAPGASFSFDYNPPGDLVLNAGDTEHNTVTVIGHDDENTSVTDTDDHTITALNVAPAIDIQKTVDADGDGQFHDFEMVQAFGDSVTYKYVLTNTSPAGAFDPITVDNLTDDQGQFAGFDLVVNGALQAGVTLVKSGGDQDALLEKDETWTYTVTKNVVLNPSENLINTATVTGHDDDGSPVTDTDTAEVLAAVVGPGVRTPGFWSNLGNQFWDGIQNNETKSGPNFPGGELTYKVDSNNDGALDNVKGLLIGDYNHDGLSAGEDTFFINLADAHKVIDASQKDLQDGRFVLARDAVATWLNFLAGNPIGGEADPNSPHHYLDEGIDWLQATNGGTAASTFEDWGGGAAVKQNGTSAWTNPMPGVPDSGNTIHTELDTYNNTGSTFEIVNGVKVFHMYASDGG